MHLKKLEVYGFKSFADPTEFEFEPGITAVVGPNGCGKSNVVDAIKWILGEQSPRSLRGKEMMDVIFSGSGTRKSLGFAEATLSFENLVTAEGKHLPEVQITRRLYRSGESEYLINKEGARLRDIKDLFLDTGVGMQAYSIIEQGRIDAILTRSPQDRRAIFEEAAGISRYKKKRIEAERKLDRTDGNLLRAGDRIEEIERRLRSLKSQASKARRFREMETRLKELRVRHSLHQYMELTEQLETVLKELDAREREVDATREAATAYEAEALRQEDRVREIDAQLEDLARARNEIDLQVAQAIGEVEYAEAMIVEIESTRAAHESEIAKLERHNENDGGELKRLEKELDTAAEEANAARLSLDSSESEETALSAGTAERRREVESMRSELIELSSRRAGLRDQVTELAAALRAVDEHAERLSTRRTELEAEVEGLKREREERDTEVSRLAEAIGEMTRTYHGREEEARAAERQLEGLGQELSRASEAYHGLLSRHELLQGICDRSEGLEGGVRELLAAAARGEAATAGVCGLVADVIETDPEHYLAVEAALGHEAESVVCRDRACAGAAAKYLADRHAGKAMLLAGDELARAERRSARAATLARAEAERGVRSQMRSCVRVGELRVDGAAARRSVFECADDGVFRRDEEGRFVRLDPLEAEQGTALASAVVEELLGNVVLVDDLPRASALARRYPELDFVTPQGELASGTALAVAATASEPAGAAGSSRAARGAGGGLVAQRNELRRLSEQADEQRERLDDVKERRNSGARRTAELDADLATLRGEIYDANIEHTEKRAATRHLEDGITQRRRELDLLGEAILSSQDERARIEARAQDADSALEAAAHEIQRSEQEIARIEEEITRLVERREQVAATMRELEVAMTRASERRGAVARAMRGVEAAISERAARVGKLREDSSEGDSKITAAKEKIAQAQARRVQHDADRAELAERSKEVTASREQARARIDEVRAEVRVARTSMEQAVARLGELKVKQSETRVTRDGLVVRVREEYGLELESLRRRRLDLPPLDPESELSTGGEAADETGELPADPAGGEHKDASGAAQAAAEVDLSIDENWEEVEREITTLRQKMSNLGNVNLEAIEEFDEVEKRFNELAGQRDDLIEAKAQLETLIHELNVRSRDLFLTTLETVRENFKQVFRKLFGGGTGDIVLGEGDPLDAGIEIFAKPPGKEPASISLLSGGEKSMTAVALLFALFKSRPSPFCVLDEVDAALDEANVTRFVSMVREFLENTQFIIITHNKRTMSVADAIHGVTMQESGVSKRISVRFEEVA